MVVIIALNLYTYDVGNGAFFNKWEKCLPPCEHIAPHPSLLGHKMGNVNHDERRQQLWIGWKDKARTNDELGPTMKLFHLESCDFFFLSWVNWAYCFISKFKSGTKKIQSSTV